MQVLLTPSSFNNHKRSRSEDDVESNYFKKRLISLSPTKKADDINDSRGNFTPTEPKYDIHIDDTLQQQNNNFGTLNNNGNALPLDHKTGETKYCIPDLILNKKNSTPTSLEAAQAGRLILYRPNTYLPLSPPSSPRKEEQEYEPMEID